MEQIKSEWQQYNNKLALTHRLNEQLIESMLKERSRSRISWIRRESKVLLYFMMMITFFLAAVIAGNPFDFRYIWQYVPYGVLMIGVLMAIVSLIRNLRNFNVNINRVDLFSFLNRTIEGYERNKKLEGWFGVIILSAGFMTVFSFLPNKIDNKGLKDSLIETGIMAVSMLVVYFLAFKLGAFRNTKKQGFENDLLELQELKTISAELKMDGKD